MIIKEIQIDHFGHFDNFRLANLTCGVNEICGLNEFGKSTIAEFVVRIFYGFPDNRSSLNPYPAACDDINYGGRLICELNDGREVVIERLGKGRKKHFSIIDCNTKEEIDREELFKLEENFYREIYALTLLQLAKGGVLEEQDNVISRRLYGMNYAAKNINIDGLVKKITESSDKIFLKNGRTQELILQYELLQEKQQQVELLEAKLHQSEKIDLEIAVLEKDLKELSERCQFLADYLKLKNEAEKLQGKISNLAEEIAELTVDQNFIDNEKYIEEFAQGVKLYQEYHNNLLVSNIELETLEKDLKNSDNEFMKMVEDDKFSHRLMDFALKEEVAIKKDKEAGDYNIQVSVKRAKIDSIVHMLMMFAIIGILGGIFMLNFMKLNNGKMLLIYSVAIFVVLSLIKVLSKRLLPLHSLDNEEKLYQEFKEFVAPCALEREYSISLAANKFSEAKKIAKEREKLLLIKEDCRQKKEKIDYMDMELLKICNRLNFTVGTDEINYVETVDKLMAKLKHNQAIAAKKNALNNQVQQEKVQLEKIYENISATEEKLNKLNLIEKDENKFNELKKEFFSINAQTALKRNEYTELLVNNDYEFAKSDCAGLKNQFKKLVQKYLSLQLTLFYIRGGIDKFEKEHQGDIILKAGEYFAAISDNRYVRVKKSLTNGEIICITADNKERRIPELSTGSREQLLLAMRLSLIEYIEKSIEPLPVILDDVFVNFDYKRREKMYQIVKKFAENRQVLFFKLANEG